jgi:hypothetical protein
VTDFPRIKKDSLDRMRESIWRHLGKSVAAYQGVDYTNTARRIMHVYGLSVSAPYIRRTYQSRKGDGLLSPESWLHSHRLALADAARYRRRWIESGGYLP